MKKRWWTLLAMIAAVGPAVGQLKPDPSLSVAEAAALKRDKIVLPNRYFRQVFSPYIMSPLPVFITSDSLLNGWHVLFEESLLAVEDRRSLTLAAILDGTLTKISMMDDPTGVTDGLWKRGLRRMQIVLGTASRLMGGKWRGEPELEALIAAEVVRVEAAAGRQPTFRRETGRDGCPGHWNADQFPTRACPTEG